MENIRSYHKNIIFTLLFICCVLSLQIVTDTLTDVMLKEDTIKLKPGDRRILVPIHQRRTPDLDSSTTNMTTSTGKCPCRSSSTKSLPY